MNYAVFNTETTQLLKTVRTQAAAKATVTRMGKSHPDIKTAWCELQNYYVNVEKQVKRKNFMTGEEFYESVNTPYYCSPSSETYWSM